MKNLFILLCCTFIACSNQANISYPILSKESGLIETLAIEFLKKTKLPGLSIAVSKNEEIIYAKGFGYADVANKVNMTPSTQLRTASVAKIITATALGRLMTEGKLNVDAPIKNYVPYIDEQYAQLTTRQLAGHTSGLAHRPAGQRYKKKQYHSTQETVELMDIPLLFSPDTDYKYSTHAFNLLAAVIEGASGKTYTAYMKENIFNPLEMQQTFPENIQELTAKDATLYYFKKDKLTKEKLTNASYKVAGAGYRSTPTDLVKLMNAYTNGFISPDVVNEMFESHQLKNGEKTKVGIVWRTSFDTFGNALVEHAGSWRGARTVVVHYPAENMTIAIMINADCQIFIEETAHIFAQLFRGEPVEKSLFHHLNQALTVTYRSNETEEQHQGTIVMNGEKGELTVERDGFLRSNPIYYLCQDNHYAAITSYGLLYLNMEQRPTLKGELYLYANRNEANPMDKKALVSFRGIE